MGKSALKIVLELFVFEIIDKVILKEYPKLFFHD